VALQTGPSTAHDVNARRIFIAFRFKPHVGLAFLPMSPSRSCRPRRAASAVRLSSGLCRQAHNEPE